MALPAVIGDLGGHDFAELLNALAQADDEPHRPTIIFAYTIKGWGLPIAGDPLNHSKLLTPEQMADLRVALDIPEGQEWAGFAPDSPAGQLCRNAAARLFPAPEPAPQVIAASVVPVHVPVFTQGLASTQQIFGRLLTQLARETDLAKRIVTTSPDVSVSTNLSGWILKHGLFTLNAHLDYETEANALMQWRHTLQGQHIELGISEMNLFMLLGMFGLSAELTGQHLIPIGTVYDPFICRGLDALIYALYSGAKFIFAGTPSGLTLSPEGGAHQSTVTPSLGLELPNLNAYEPCFALELEWILLEAIRHCCDREHGRSTYLRLSTKAIDQQLLAPALERLGEAELQRQVLGGGYRLVEAGGPVTAQLVATGVMVPEAVAAAAALKQQGVAVNVINLTSPRRLFETWRVSQTKSLSQNPVSNLSGFQGSAGPLDWLIPAQERHVPLVTVHDGAPHALAWLGSVYGAPLTPLGVDNFGQSGTRAELYRHYQIDAEAMVAAVLALEQPA
jgi:pyruvate dehydrogenase E1 component